MAKSYYMQAKSGEVFTTQYPEYYKDCEVLTNKAGKEAKKEQSRKQLAKYFVDGATIYTLLRKVSASGMTRQIDVYAIVDNAPVYLTGYAADVLGWSRAKTGNYALIVSGCGMDMGFHVVSSLAYCVGVDYKNIRHDWI